MSWSSLIRSSIVASFLSAGAILLSGNIALAQVTVTVPADANIFGAGHATAPAPGGGSGGELPIEVPFTAGPGQIFTFPAVTGAETISPDVPNGGGDGSDVFGTIISSYDGISGIEDDDACSFLVGVFLDDSEPSDPAPAVLNFTGDTNFTTLSPLLNQTFFVGDGLTGTGSGSLQQFNAPATADRLFLGFADGDGVQGPPGEYQDNSGSLSVTASVPEPSIVALLGIGTSALLGFRPRRRGPCAWRPAA